MVIHVVIFTWIAGTPAHKVDYFGQALDELAAEVSDVVAIRHGRDLSFREGNGDYALILTFADQAAWSAYQAHPKHKAFVRDVVTPIQASRVAIQFSSGETLE